MLSLVGSYRSMLPRTMARAGAVVTVMLFLLQGGAIATSLELVDADTIVVGSTRFRLDGVDAPENDQICLDSKGQPWSCGQAARQELIAHIADRAVSCRDLGPDRVYPQRRIGECGIQGETQTINQWLVSQGLAINFEPYSGGRYLALQTGAKAMRRGIWSGCFVEPQQFRRWEKKSAPLLGPNCPDNAKDLIFPDDPKMPAGCSIKGKLSSKAGGEFRGIYHVEGCRSYRQLKFPNRWFCTEEDAIANGFRKAKNCR